MKLDNLEKAFFWLFTEATRRELMEYAPEDIDFEAAEQELNAAKKVADAQWISVKDRLPNPLKAVLAFDGRVFGVAWTRCTFPMDGVWGSFDDYLIRDRVTHWMPLPNPPEV